MADQTRLDGQRRMWTVEMGLHLAVAFLDEDNALCRRSS